MTIILPFCSCYSQPDVAFNILRPFKIIWSYNLTWLPQATRFSQSFLYWDWELIWRKTTVTVNSSNYQNLNYGEVIDSPQKRLLSQNLNYM